MTKTNIGSTMLTTFPFRSKNYVHNKTLVK